MNPSTNMISSQPTLGRAVDRLNATALRAGNVTAALRDQLGRLGVYGCSDPANKHPGGPTSPASQITEIHNSLDGLVASLADIEAMTAALDRTLAREPDARCAPEPEPTTVRRY